MAFSKRLILLIIIAVEVSLTSGVDEVECHDGFVSVGSGFYYFGEKGTTWYEAQIICAQRGSTLVTIDSAEEKAALLAEIKRFNGDNSAAYWTSGIDYIDGVKGRWHWTDTGRDFTTGYTNWWS